MVGFGYWSVVEVAKEDGIVGLVVYEEVEVWKIIKFELGRNWWIVELVVEELKCWDVRQVWIVRIGSERFWHLG